MIAKQTLFLITVLALGCGPRNTSNNGSIDGFKNGTPPDTTGGAMSLLQTVEGSGFSVQAPAGWTVLPAAGSGVGIASPFDLAKEVAPTPVSIAILPSNGTVKPTEIAAALLQNNRDIGDVESETQIKGIVCVFVPLEAGVLAVQIQGLDSNVKSIMPQLDAIIESIKLK